VYKSKRRYLFFKGLLRIDKELVLFLMPEPRLDKTDIATYNIDLIYKFIRKIYQQQKEIKETFFS